MAITSVASLVVIDYFLDRCHLNLIAIFRKHHPQGMHKVYGILALAVARQRMTSTDMVLHHALDRVRGPDFAQTLRYAPRSLVAVFLSCNRGVRAYLLNLLVPIIDVQAITSTFTYKVNSFYGI